MTVEDIARICHEVNRAYCLTIGDTSQKPWEEATPGQRDSCIEGVKLHQKQNLTPEQSHAAWSAHKVANGWVYGPEKNEDLKTHPCLVPYDQLPLEQRTKDYLFKAVVDAA